jgi:hypothetical protein
MEGRTKRAVGLIWRESLPQHPLNIEFVETVGTLKVGSGPGEKALIETFACKGKAYRVMGGF